MRWPPVLPVLAIALAACVGDGTGLDENGNPIGTPPPGDSVTLSGDVQPIFTANCAVSGCHAGTSPAVGQNLSAGQAWAAIVNVTSQESPALMRVRPFLPDSSYLVHKIQGTQGSVGGGGGQMPLGGSPLAAEQIATIRAWITAGALDN
jgi:mono/diheme cytochrome c family protein